MEKELAEAKKYMHKKWTRFRNMMVDISEYKRGGSLETESLPVNM
jgi:hypothetical protein